MCPCGVAGLVSLKERGLDPSEGLLVVIDGGKGLRAAVQKAFGPQAAVQRCQWHKWENMVGYLKKGEQALWRGRLQRAYERPTYAEAHSALGLLLVELKDRNQSAAASLAEGLEETLTLHRLGVYGVLGASFKTTNASMSRIHVHPMRATRAPRPISTTNRPLAMARPNQTGLQPMKRPAYVTRLTIS
jgi:transposase-like protein